MLPRTRVLTAPASQIVFFRDCRKESRTYIILYNVRIPVVGKGEHERDNACVRYRCDAIRRFGFVHQVQLFLSLQVSHSKMQQILQSVAAQKFYLSSSPPCKPYQTLKVESLNLLPSLVGSLFFLFFFLASSCVYKIKLAFLTRNALPICLLSYPSDMPCHCRRATDYKTVFCNSINKVRLFKKKKREENHCI